jgi:hypothetical protein
MLSQFEISCGLGPWEPDPAGGEADKALRLPALHQNSTGERRSLLALSSPVREARFGEQDGNLWVVGSR